MDIELTADIATDETLAEEPAKYDPMQSLDITYASCKLVDIVSSWRTHVVERIERDRELRFQEVDVERARATNKLGSDEAFAPVRLIETGIGRLKPAFLGYLRGPTNLVMFINPEKPHQSFEDLEVAVDRLIKYPGWDSPYIKCIDCMLAHAFGAIEVLYDNKAPGHVSLEYIAKEDLMVHVDTEEVRQQEYVMRCYKWTHVALKTHAKAFEFDEEVTNDLCQNKNTSQNTIKVFKVYIKTINGLYVAWWAEDRSDKWLKDPMPYYVGFEEPETEIPIFILPKDLIEDSRLLAGKGVCFTLGDTQKIISAIYSGVANGVMRASNPVFSPEQPDAGNQEPLTFKSGTVSRVPLKMHVVPYPAAELLFAADNLKRNSMSDLGLIDYALQNRTSASDRKTATEVASASQTQQNLNSVSVLNLSNFIRDIYTYAWRIIQNEALNDRIVLLGERDPMTGIFVNDKVRISGDFLVLAAGDREFLRREEAKAAMQQLMPYVQNTPLARLLVADWMSYMLPINGAKYRQQYLESIKAQDMTLGLLEGWLERFSTQGVQLPTGGIGVEFAPEEIQQLAQILNEYKRIYGVTTGTEVGMATTSNNQAIADITGNDGQGTLPLEETAGTVN